MNPGNRHGERGLPLTSRQAVFLHHCSTERAVSAKHARSSSLGQGHYPPLEFRRWPPRGFQPRTTADQQRPLSPAKKKRGTCRSYRSHLEGVRHRLRSPDLQERSWRQVLSVRRHLFARESECLSVAGLSSCDCFLVTVACREAKMHFPIVRRFRKRYAAPL